MTWTRWALLLCLLASVAEARTVRVQWDYLGEDTGQRFVLEACLLGEMGCTWRPVQRLGMRQRATRVDVPEGHIKCFQLWTVRGTDKAGPSNPLCLQ